jgi:hypothetical protein
MHPSGPALGLTQPPIKCVQDLFPGVKRPGRGVKHPLAPRAEVKENLQLYLRVFMACSRTSFIFIF